MIRRAQWKRETHRQRWRGTSFANDGTLASPWTAARGSKRTVEKTCSTTGASRSAVLRMSVAGFTRDPREVVAAAGVHVDDDEFRKLVRVQLDQSCVKRGKLLASGFDGDLALDVA